MISYKANYETGKRPYICKVLTASSGEEFHTALNYENNTERLEMSAELIYEHLENCTKYIEDKSKELKIIQLNEDKNEEESVTVTLSDHVHDETSDHTHDPETGDEIPNA
jgi:hypothetical protein